MTLMTFSERTISRRWREMGLKGSGATEASLPVGEVVQLVVDHMAQDPDRRAGKSELKRRIALRSGIHLRRYAVHASLSRKWFTNFIPDKRLLTYRR